MRWSPVASLARILIGFAALAASATPERVLGQSRLPVVIANSNTEPAGSLGNGVLEVALVAMQARWHPEALDGPSLDVEAFAVEAAAPAIPGPLLRVPLGTTIAARVRNALPDTLLVFGLSNTAGVADTVRIAPGTTSEVRITPALAGTFAYGGVTITGGSRHVLGTGNQLVGALIVDDAESAARADRVFVLGIWPPVPGRFVLAINGRSWPHTERLATTVGDSVHWRIINATRGRHPMHLHGFYFRIDSRGSWTADTLLTGDRPVVVTEPVPLRGTFAMTWVAERPGNWLFHCHDLLHTTWRRRYNLTGERPPLMPPMAHGEGHAEVDMSGLVLGIVAHPGDEERIAEDIPRRELRLLIEEHPGHYGANPAYAYSLQHSVSAAAGPRIPAEPLVLTRGEGVAITVVNRSTIGTAVHWHGIELDSYYDGVAGWSGDERALAPLIAPEDSFVVRFTPPRAGTFIVHAHADDVRQVALGLYGALIVLPQGTMYDPARDHVFMASQLGRGATATTGLNGHPQPAPITLLADNPHRFRIVNIGVEYDAAFELRAANGAVTWLPLAKDGADLPASRRLRGQARVHTAPGETYDFEVTLPAGDYRLQLEGADTIEQMLYVRRDSGRDARAVIGFTRTREDIDAPGDYRTDAEIWVMNDDGSAPRRLTRNDTDDYGIAWSPDGRTMAYGATRFVRDDADELVVSTQRIYLLDLWSGVETLLTDSTVRGRLPSWSPDGSRIAFDGTRDGSLGQTDIFTIAPDGKGMTALAEGPFFDARPDWSPDGRRIAFQSDRDGSMEVWVMDADGANAIQLTYDTAGVVNQAPDWAPDGRRIVFVSTRDGNAEIYTMANDGSSVVRVTRDPARDTDPEWSHDGSRILFDHDIHVGDRDVRQIFIMNPDGSGIEPLTALPSSNGHAAWRPAAPAD